MRPAETPKITVAIRKRPLNKKELQRAETDIVRVSPHGQVTISEYKQKVDLTKYLEQTTFNFDYAYDERSNNEEIYEQAIRPLISNAFQGAKISCFAYGQTGSGKTFTMKGDLKQGVPGLYYLGARQIFRLLEEPQHAHLHVTVSFYEIYCRKLYDLLNNRAQLPLREDKNQNINVIGMEQKLICSANEFMELIEFGSTFRVTSQNATNADSSRSHAILQISLKQHKKTFTKISFIDLAGNERGADHMNQNKQTQIDGAEINKSLLSLKECIRALDQGKSHTPFRGSKLTMVLKDSFVGFCNTVMICNVSPNVTASENTMNTLRYADRVKQLKGQDQRQSLTREEQLSRELMLPRGNNKNCIKVSIDSRDDNEDIMSKMEHARLQHNNRDNWKAPRQEEEKMDIEEPVENKKPSLLIGRKAESIVELRPNNPPLERKFPAVGRDHRAMKMGSQVIGTWKGRQQAESDKQPLLSHNNNLNFANTPAFHEEINFNKRIAKSTNPTLSLVCNRNQFEAMTILRNEYEQHRQQQQLFDDDESSLMGSQRMIAREPRKIGLNGHTPEEQIEDVNRYLTQMQTCIAQRMELFQTLKNNIERMRLHAKTASDATARMRFEQQQSEAQQRVNLFNNNGNGNGNGNGSRSQTKLHLHSTNNCINFSGFNQYSNSFDDDQLLEGLPGDDTMSRLF